MLKLRIGESQVVMHLFFNIAINVNMQFIQQHLTISLIFDEILQSFV